MQLDNPLSLPTDAVRWTCLALAILLVWRCPKELVPRRPPPWLMWLAPLTAAMLSAGYVAYYLRGQPRIIDATAYYLQARTFAAGAFSLPLPEIDQAVMGRFLVRTPSAATAAVIFPPGYPALLSLGFRAGVPMAVGPALAAALVVATMSLARQAARRLDLPAGPSVTIAALLSVGCAALRYHTADTMSHGLAALCVTVALASWLSFGTPGKIWPAALLLGSSLGMLFATRPASALALGTTLTVALLLGPARPPKRAWLGVMAGAAGPLLLWFLYQQHATGSPWSTAQALYYTVSDGPPGCFRYGFGSDVGCLGEHGTFVRANLADGYGLVEAAKTTGRRLMMHASDAMGFAPAFAAIGVGVLASWKKRGLRVLTIAVILQWLFYAPFYFDGNYPGGGARMFADVLPVEHVLAALGLHTWRVRGRSVSPQVAASVLLAGSLLGFAVHLGAHHEQLRDREGGQPMFRPLAGNDFDVRSALLFVDTDHGFNLAFDPTAPNRVARTHGDALDRLAWESAGRPQALAYRFSFETGTSTVLSIATETLAARHTIEGESLWPATHQRDGYAFPRHISHPCVSRGRVLAVRPTKASAEVRLALPDALAGQYLGLTVIALDRKVSLKSVIYSDGRPIVATASAVSEADGCTLLEPLWIPPGRDSLELRLLMTGPIGLDKLESPQNR